MQAPDQMRWEEFHEEDFPFDAHKMAFVKFMLPFYHLIPGMKEVFTETGMKAVVNYIGQVYEDLKRTAMEGNISTFNQQSVIGLLYAFTGLSSNIPEDISSKTEGIVEYIKKHFKGLNQPVEEIGGKEDAKVNVSQEGQEEKGQEEKGQEEKGQEVGGHDE